MNLAKSWFNFKNQFKSNVKNSFEKNVRKSQATIKIYSLAELYKKRIKLMIFLAMIVVINVLTVPLIYVGVSSSHAWSYPFWWFIFISVLLVILLVIIDYLFIVDLVAINRSIAITEKYSATKRRNKAAK